MIENPGHNFSVGDLVRRTDGKSKYERGRVTGFTPDGRLRVSAGNHPNAVWKPASTVLVESAKPRATKSMTVYELDLEISRCADEVRLQELLSERLERDLESLTRRDRP